MLFRSCEYIAGTKSGTAGADSVKVKGNIHWVSARHAHAAPVRLYDRLFKTAHPGAGGQDYLLDLNPDSAKTITAQLEAALKEANVDIGVMAYVTQFVPQDFVNIPKHGMIQFHPSLLPLHRGASSMSWSIICGRTETGFSIFRPNDGLDEGPVIKLYPVAIEPDDTLGTLYFNKIFPAGVAGLMECADLVLAGKVTESVQDETNAGYEGVIREAESRINWANHVDFTYKIGRAHV